jgi:hypothetical protein
MSEKIDYTGQETIFMSYAAIRDGIFKHDFGNLSKTNFSKIPLIQKEKAHRLKREIPSKIPFRDDPNILLAIQNDSTIVHVTMCCKGNKEALAYIYVESDGFINFIIKNPNGYPLILAKIPVDDNYIMTRAPNCCFDFPLKDILNKDIKYTRKNVYNIIYRKVESEMTNIQFIYELYDSESNVNTSLVLQNIKINGLQIINNLFKSVREGIKVVDETQYISSFKGLNIIVLKLVSDTSVNLTTKCTNNAVSKIVLTPTTMKFASITNRQNVAQELATSETSLIWNVDEEEEFQMSPFENMFKANFNKIYNQAERVYYVFGIFLGIHVFIKMISPIHVKEVPMNFTLNSIFDGKYQFYECYYLTKL